MCSGYRFDHVLEFSTVLMFCIFFAEWDRVTSSQRKSKAIFHHQNTRRSCEAGSEFNSFHVESPFLCAAQLSARDSTVTRDWTQATKFCRAVNPRSKALFTQDAEADLRPKFAYACCEVLCVLCERGQTSSAWRRLRGLKLRKHPCQCMLRTNKQVHSWWLLGQFGSF